MRERKKIDNVKPLNLKENYNDNVLAFKILLNLSDNDEVKLLGQQIIDSFILLSLIHNNKMLKDNINNYSVLIEKLSITINKYSKFKKLLRKNDVKTKAFLSDKYLFNKELSTSDINVLEQSRKSMNESKSYININKDSYSYSLNEILDSTNIFDRILCIDDEQLFKTEINSRALNKKSLVLSEDTTKLIKRKNSLLRKTISSEKSISSRQFILYDKINNLYKNLIYLEYQIDAFEKCDNEFNSKLLFLESDVVNEYKKFLGECKKVYTKAIRERKFVYENLNSLLNDYSSLLVGKNSTTVLKESKISYSDELNRERKTVIKNYIKDRIFNNDGKQIGYISYLENNCDNKQLLEQEKINSNDYLSMYSSYLIYKSGVSKGQNVIPFERFISDMYGIDKIDPIYSIKI